MDATTKRSICERARNRCEYCQLPQAAQPFVTFHVEHIIPRKHDGSDDPSNLALRAMEWADMVPPSVRGIDPGPIDDAWLSELMH
jgi:hypothetical protein